MRLEGKTLSECKLIDMANNLGNTIEKIPKGTLVIIDQYHKNAGTGYYHLTKYNGWVVSRDIKVLRDIEFFYTSSLAPMMRANALALNEIETRDLVGGTTTGGIVESGTSGEFTGSSGMIMSQEQLKYAKFGVGVAAHYINNSEVTNIANDFIQNRDWKTTMNNTSLNSLLSTDSSSVLGQILNGATIGNIANGSFFDNVIGGSYSTLINNLYVMLMRKIAYVVGKAFGSKWGWLLRLIDDVFLDKSIYYMVKNTVGNLNGFTYAPITQDMINYFRYKGCDYKMITRTFGTLWRWEQDAYYSTPTLESKQDPEEVAFYRSMYNNTYSEFKDAIGVAKENLNLNMERLDWFRNFNRYRLVHPDSSISNAIGYVFFTRPDLNIKDPKSGVALSQLAPLMYNMVFQHPELALSLTTDYTSLHYFIPYLSNKFLSIDIPDEQIKTREVGETLTGFKICYAFHNIESITANTVTTTFSEDEQLSTYLYFKLWTEYMAGVARGLIKPKRIYVKRKQLDYAISIYYFLCASDGESILYWTKFTGAFPTNVPSSAFGIKDGERVTNPTQTITWQYSEKRDYNPLHLAEFNNLTSSDYTYIKQYSQDTLHMAPTLQGAPFVDTNTGGRLFKLRFRQPIYTHSKMT